jgi:hypothetical protein
MNRRERMSQVLVSLVSKQTIPNVLFIKEMEGKLSKKIEKYVFITTELMKKKKKTDSIISTTHIPRSKIRIIKVIEDSIENIENQLENFAKNELHDDDRCIVNLTGGTKIMSIGIYTFFKERGSIIYYLPIGKNVYKQIFPLEKQKDNVLDYRISLDDYLTSYGMYPQNRNELLKDKEYTKKFYKTFLQNDLDPEIIERLRKERNQKKVPLDEEIKLFLEEIHFELENEKFINKKEINYITGGWFEEYGYSLVKEHLSLKDDELGLNVQISHDGTQNEFDIMIVHENILTIIECKTSLDDNGKNLLNDTLYKLSALNKELGLQVNSYLFTLDENLRDEKGEIKSDCQNRADLLDIMLIDRKLLEDEIELKDIFNRIKGGNTRV